MSWSEVSPVLFIPWASLTVGCALLIGDQASDQDWLLNLPETKDKGALRSSQFVPSHVVPCRLVQSWDRKSKENTVGRTTSRVIPQPRPCKRLFEGPWSKRKTVAFGETHRARPLAWEKVPRAIGELMMVQVPKTPPCHEPGCHRPECVCALAWSRDAWSYISRSQVQRETK